MTDDEILRLPFDINRHKAARYLDLEIMMAPNGTAVYALPSHQEFLVKKAMELQNWTREALMDACPPEFYTAFMNWLIPLSGGWIPVWPIGVLDYPLTRPQVALLRKLKMAGLYHGYIPAPVKTIVGEKTDEAD